MTDKKRKNATTTNSHKKRNPIKPPFHSISKFFHKIIEYLDVKSTAKLEISLAKCLISDILIDNTNYRKNMLDYASNEAFINWIINRKLYLKHIIIDGSFYNDITLIQKYINNSCKSVETIRIISIDDLTDKIMLQSINNCLNVNSIYINDCNMISDHFVASLLLLKPHLLSLTIIHCNKITYNIVKLIENFRELRKITLNNNVITNETDYNKISNLPKLRRFNLIENMLDNNNFHENDNINKNSDNYDDEVIDGDDNYRDSNNSSESFSVDSVNTYSSNSDTDSIDSNNLSNDFDNNSTKSIDSDESSISLDTLNSDLSCPLLVYN